MISVIIPVYNVEKYLKRCIDSVCKQLSSDDEIILVDDGSKDSSPQICDEYARRERNIYVIHKENAGLSMARNDGLEKATGKYILFLDSDDYLESGCIDRFKTVGMNYQCDLITAKARWFRDDGVFHDKASYQLSEGLYDADSYINMLKKTNSYLPCAPFYIYRKEFLKENALSFYPGMLHEDEMWMPMVLLKAKSIYYCDVYFYCNYRRDGSITQSKENLIKGARDMCKICQELNETFQKQPHKSKIFKDRMVTKVLETLCESQDLSYFVHHIKRTYPIRNACTLRNYLKGAVYFISPNLYLKAHKIVKGF